MGYKKDDKAKNSNNKTENNKSNNINNNKKNKSGNNIIGVLFITLVVFIIIGFLSVSMVKTGDTSGYFNKNDRVVAKGIYDKIMNITEEGYPKTPEQVVTLYTEGYKLLYGNKIKDLSIVPGILEKQRILLSDDLIANNAFDEQVDIVLANIENLKKNKAKVTSINVNEFTYDKRDNTLAYVKVSKEDNSFQTYYYVYYLKLEGDKWKITGWYNADENYNIIS
ncbi:DUF6715 family protein [uncultured Tyzzerella sp.]|uniref:DUF6715 family protein n=1 Tax=uncultured Tyzzerella sp. TaxID=2321398 RepID=UPI002943D8F2|nr:DUF6715 family protein [uncultured Tyzzerella sp.]